MNTNTVIILAGGKGLRIYSEKNSLSKPLAKINGKPLIFFVINTYLKNGLKNFIICTGANTKAVANLFEKSKNLFKNFNLSKLGRNYFRFTLKNKNKDKFFLRIVNTGTTTMTGGRIKRVKKFLKNHENFCVSYCDTVSNINIKKQIKYHIKKKKIATLAAVSIPDRFGLLKIKNDKILSFSEKPKIKDKKINGGFFVFNKEIFNYISDDQTVLEENSLTSLAKKKELVAFKHHGFWQCVDNLKDQNFVSEYLRKKNVKIK